MCRDRSNKRSLTRIVRQPDGLVAIDPTGRLNGRGTYVCDKQERRSRAANTDALAKALNAEISDELREEIRQLSVGESNENSAGTAIKDGITV